MNVRTVSKFLLVLLCGVAVASAQEREGREGRGGRRFGGGGMGFGVDQLTLLRVEKVQQELDLVDDQVSKIRDLAESRRPRGPGRGDGPNSQNGTDEQRRELFQQRRNEVNAEIKKILLEDQLARLQQIYVQVAGAGQALSDPDVVAKLNLTEDQQAQIAATRQQVQEDHRGQLQELFGSGDREAIQAKMQELRQEGDEKVLAHLTAEQKDQFAALKGEPFELSMEEIGAARGGRRGFGVGGRGGPGGGRRGAGGERPDRPQRPE
jgi:hypothetical protein